MTRRATVSDGNDLSPGLPPVSAPGIHTLVLGSLPSRLSIERQEYYGNPQNAFWRIMAELAGFDSQLPYAERESRLLAAGVGLWDVLASSVRPGSLDANIDLKTARPNDLVAFLDGHRKLRRIAFNGRKARQIFDKELSGSVEAERRGIGLLDLPSTSPAHAALSFDGKLNQWSALFAPGA